MADVIIRQVKMEDVETITELMAQLGYSSNLIQMQCRVRKIQEESGRHQILVAALADKVIGLIHLQRRLTLLSNCSVEIVSLVVDENYRSRGIGKLLLDAAEQWAHQQNAVSLMLYSNCKRELAHQFYRRNGYDKIKDSIMLQKECHKARRLFNS